MLEVAEDNNNNDPEPPTPPSILPLGSGGEDVPKIRLKKVKIDLSTSEIKPVESEHLEVAKEQKEFVVSEDPLPKAKDKTATHKVSNQDFDRIHSFFVQ